MWFEEASFYHIYPLGLCNAPQENDGVYVNRIAQIESWIPHLQEMGCSAVYFGPLMQSDRHGYDTRDYREVDCRLGNNDDLAELCRQLHAVGIRIIIDGVFNHVGRGFWAFQDVLQNRENSPYTDWFTVDFNGNSNYDDGLWYEGWEGHFELVKLNLHNPAVVEHLLTCVDFWIDRFDVDGIRLDVAYLLEDAFMERLASHTKNKKADFFLLGEIIHGDYNRLLAEGRLDSCTNYECYKGMYSSLNDVNMFEIAHSLNRQYNPEQGALYLDKHLAVFLDNHDVSRIASQLKEQKHLPLAYGMLFTLPGIPFVYYGSEWGMEGNKEEGDAVLRPAVSAPSSTELTRWIGRLAALHTKSKALCYGNYTQLYLTNQQLAFKRQTDSETVVVVLNLIEQEAPIHHQIEAVAEDMLTGEQLQLTSGMLVPGYSFSCWRI